MGGTGRPDLGVTPSLNLRRGVSMKIPDAKLGEIEPASPLEVGKGNQAK